MLAIVRLSETLKTAGILNAFVVKHLRQLLNPPHLKSVVVLTFVYNYEMYYFSVFYYLFKKSLQNKLASSISLLFTSASVLGECMQM